MGPDETLDGVADGTRTHDDRNHNPGLYQLSYSHRRANNYIGAGVTTQPPAAALAARAAAGSVSARKRFFSAAR
jgi:hypothetical protein